MLELNPHRKTAVAVAFALYSLAGLVLLAGVFFTIASAYIDPSEFGRPGITNQHLIVVSAGMFLLMATMLILLARRVQVLFGTRIRQEKVAVKSAVACLTLGSWGCGLWTVLASVITAMLGKLLTGDPAGIREIFIGASGSAVLIIIMRAVAWFISTNYVPPKSEEMKRAFEKYRDDIKLRLLTINDPATRAYMQEQTKEILDKLDVSLKSVLFGFLMESGLLWGQERITISGADFRGVDLRSFSFPRADLREVNLERANLLGVPLFQVDLHRANLREAELGRAFLQNANLQNANLTRASLKAANMTEADLSGAILKDATLEGAILENANLTDADLTGANLKNANLKGAVIAPAQLQYARLQGTILPDGVIVNQPPDSSIPPATAIEHY
ncbi:MAG: hypothetical protein DMF61_02125 [Blastocatellia bacterium AA13]|nr:MAG: hypothetical protein DMF61_02125 [Blastocatellia bacterium AA13]